MSSGSGGKEGDSKSSTAAPQGTRGRGGLRPVAAALTKVTGPILGKRGLGEAQIRTEWPSIMGPELADQTAPEKLSFPPGERRHGTLRLRVAPGAATAIQHREPRIIERINAFFGYPAVARLVLIQAPLKKRGPVVPPAPRPLRPEERARLDGRLAAVGDPDLRAALDRLGRAVLGNGGPKR
jgi:hypothetical protein